MLRKTYLGNFNMLALDETSQEFITEYLSKNPRVKYFDKEKRYALLTQDPNSNDVIKQEFKVSHSFYVRERKPEKPSGTRLEVIDIDNPLGDGADGTTYRSLCEWIPKQKSLQFKEKHRAIKISSKIELLQREQQAAKHTPHLSPKPLTIIYSGSFFAPRTSKAIMANRLLPGTNLYQIIAEETAGKITLSIDQRLALTIAILQAYKREIYDCKLIHRDIKPENIMVDLATMEVHFIDYSYCKIIDDPQSTPGYGGSLITMPLEQFQDCATPETLYTIASDFYALGKTIAELWGAIAEVELDTTLDNELSYKMHYIKYAGMDTRFEYSKLHTNGLSLEDTAQLKTILEGMTKCLPSERLDPNTALEIFRAMMTSKNDLFILAPTKSKPL